MNKATEYYELLNRIKSYIPSMNNWKDKFDSIQRIEADRFSRFYFGEALEKRKGCGCVEDFINIAKFITFDHITKKLEKMQRQFEIQKGKLISLGSSDYTNDNITDEKALQILEQAPGFINYFSKYPSNWRDMIGQPNANLSLVSDSPETSEREAELLKKQKKTLQKIAKEVAESKKITAPFPTTGIPKLVKFIMDNE